MKMLRINQSTHWLSLFAWQLGIVTAAAIANDADTSNLFQLAHQFPFPGLTFGLGSTFEPLEHCPKPSPCHRTAKAEFCVFTAEPSDGMGTNSPVPIVAEHKRALEIMRTITDAHLPRNNSASQPKHLVRPIPGKGLGVISIGELKRGEKIMSNAPSLVIDHCMMATVPPYDLARLMNDAAGRLPDVHRGRLMDLAVFGGAPDEHYRVGRIYATNAYMLDSDEALFGDGCGVGALFPECECREAEVCVFYWSADERNLSVARVNHDCRPNAAYHFNPDTSAMEVHAVRPIAAGEEITVSYIRYKTAFDRICPCRRDND